MNLKKLLTAAARSEKFRFLVVGGYNTLFGYGLFAVLIWLVGDRAHYLIILVLSHVVAVTNGYFAHRFLVFRDSALGQRSYWRYHLVNLVNLGFSAVALVFLVEIVRLTPIVSQGLIVSIAVVLTYVLHKRYSFAK